MVTGRAIAMGLVLMLLASCHEGEPQGAIEPKHPIIGKWEDIEDPTLKYEFLDEELVDAVTPTYFGPIPGDSWSRQAERFISISTRFGSERRAPETVETLFDDSYDCVMIAWRADGGSDPRKLARDGSGPCSVE